jgi:hypothetical protein
MAEHLEAAVWYWCILWVGSDILPCGRVYQHRFQKIQFSSVPMGGVSCLIYAIFTPKQYLQPPLSPSISLHKNFTQMYFPPDTYLSPYTHSLSAFLSKNLLPPSLKGSLAMRPSPIIPLSAPGTIRLRSYSYAAQRNTELNGTCT